MRYLTIVAAAASALALVATAAAATPPSTAAFTACLKKHGVTLGKTTDQAKISAAFVACRSSAPTGGAVGRPRALTPAQQAAFKKYTDCMAKHGVKLTFRPAFASGQRPAPASGQQPSGARQIPRSAKFRAAEKACASVRPKLAGQPGDNESPGSSPTRGRGAGPPPPPFR